MEIFKVSTSKSSSRYQVVQFDAITINLTLFSVTFERQRFLQLKSKIV